MAVGDIFRVTMEQALHSQTIMNTLHYRCVTTGGADSPVLAALITSNITPLMKAVQSNELTHGPVYVQKIWPLPPLLPAANNTAIGVAGVAQNSLPTSMAVVITKKTEFAGRKYRGRFFAAGVPVTHENDSRLALANVAAWQALADALDDVLVTPGWSFQPVLWHKATKTYHDLMSGEVRLILRNQRRRQVGKGI